MSAAISRDRSPQTPLDCAYRLLARRAYSEQELTEKLCANGFPVAAVSSAVARLKSQGYLDDIRLAADQVERLWARGFGPEAIRAKLSQKGLSLHTIEHALAVGEEDQDRQSARRLLASRFSTDALEDFQTRVRAFRLLLRRGYSQEVAESLLGGEPEDD